MRLVKNIVVAIMLSLPAIPILAQYTNTGKTLFVHTQIERQRAELSEGVYAFMGYSSSNFGVIRSKHGYILIDTGDDFKGVEAAMKEIAALASGRLQAIILTHSHPDHCAGKENNIWVNSMALSTGLW